MLANIHHLARLTLFLIIGVPITYSQDHSVHDLAFLIGTWEVREDNEDRSWWEESTRTGRYVLDSTYIELDAVAISSSGKKRTYRWLIHYDWEAQQFEMVSFFSNWPRVQIDLLSWDPATRRLTIVNKPNPGPYHERYGVLEFGEDFTSYTWTGENKSGDPSNPNIWRYIEKGERRQ